MAKLPTVRPLAFSQVKTAFNGSSNFADYYRGGPYVPNIAANAAISATASGLRLSQFLGAETYEVAVNNESPFGGLGANATITYLSSGGITISGGTTTGWLVGGSGNFQIRFTNLTGPDSGDVIVTLNTWMSLASNRSASLLGADPQDTKTASVDVEIRDADTLASLGTATIDFTATNA